MLVTVGDLIKVDVRLAVRCHLCGYTGTIFPEYIAWRVGENRNVDTIKWRCFNGCRGKVTLQLAPRKARPEIRGGKGSKGFY